MFRRRRPDETILPCTKPFFPFGADIPKPSLINNSLNETPPGVGIGSLSCRTSSPSTRQPGGRFPPPGRHVPKCCCEVLQGAPPGQCLGFPPAITSGFTASCCAWC